MFKRKRTYRSWADLTEKEKIEVLYMMTKRPESPILTWIGLIVFCVFLVIIIVITALLLIHQDQINGIYNLTNHTIPSTTAGTKDALEFQTKLNQAVVGLFFIGSIFVWILFIIELIMFNKRFKPLLDTLKIKKE